MQVAAPIRCKLQEERLAMAAMSYVPDIAVGKLAIGAWHRFYLRAFFSQSKTHL